MKSASAAARSSHSVPDESTLETVLAITYVMPVSSDWNTSWCGQGPYEPATASHSSDAEVVGRERRSRRSPTRRGSRSTDRRMRPDVEVGPAW
jgi:hypothetical protein